MSVHRISEFEIWQRSFASASVTVYIANTLTKANIFTDEALSIAALNPQTLITFTDTEGFTYGKFDAPLYTSSAYELQINTTDTTGIVRPPLTTLDGQDASDSTVIVDGGSVTHNLDTVLARIVDVRDFGDWKSTSEPDDSASDNTTTLTAAIGAASNSGGGTVDIPAGTFLITTINLPADVALRGRGHGVTIIQSTSASDVVTITGAHAGLLRLTLDGSSQVAGSVGLKMVGIDETDLFDMEIKRFETGLYAKGGRKSSWVNVHLDNCVNGALLHGDNDSGSGDQFRNNSWVGGSVENCTTLGVEYSYFDLKCAHNHVANVGFDTNTGTALKINGARFTEFEDCWFANNTVNLEVLDDADTSVNTNTVIGLHFNGGSMEGGAANLDDTCQDVIFEKIHIEDVDFTFTGLKHRILLLDCIEDSLVTFAGDTTYIQRKRNVNGDFPGVSGTTTDATPVAGWDHYMEPGVTAHIQAVVIASQQESEKYAVYEISQSVRRPGSVINYDAQTVNYTLGSIATGATSGAQGRIVAITDTGTTGDLTLRQLNGIPFDDNELITDAAGGSADADGVLSEQAPVMIGAIVAPMTEESTVGMAAIFDVSSTEVNVTVTGVAAETWDWVIHGKVTEIS